MTHSLNLVASKDPMTVQALSAVSAPTPVVAEPFVSMMDEDEAMRYAEQNQLGDDDDDDGAAALRGIFD